MSPPGGFDLGLSKEFFAPGWPPDDGTGGYQFDQQL